MARGLGFSITEKGADEAGSALEQLGRRAQDARPASYKVRTVFRKAERRRFDYSGPGWAPLEATTRERKSREQLDPRILRAKGALYRSLTSPTAAFQIDRRDRTEFEFGTDVPYARFHEQGRGVPQRKLIDLTPAEHRDLTSTIESYIAQGDTR